MDQRPGSRAIAHTTLSAILLFSLSVSFAGNDPNVCDAAGEEPNLIVKDVTSVARFGTVGGVSAYSFGDTHCNLGSCHVDWIHNSNRHPVTTQNFYRYEGAAFEQLGQSWVLHAFFALSSEDCSDECEPTNGTHLGVSCSDVNSAATEAQQGQMGPRSQIDAAKGLFSFPFATQGQSGNAVYKRLQVRDSDQDPQLHPDALFFGEVQMVNPDDAAVGNLEDNVAHRRVLVTPGAGGSFQWSFSGPSATKRAAIHAWRDLDPGVLLTGVSVPSDGLLFLGARVTKVAGGLWRYEYAIQNRTSHRSVGSFRVPLPAGAAVSEIGFHDVDYHSGEPYDGTDWPGAVDGASVAWTTASFAVNPNANALRWGTLYNFRFVSEIPPAVGSVTLGLFRPGSLPSVTVETFVPEPCDSDGACEPGEVACACFADCGIPAPMETACDDAIDDDCDGLADCTDAECCEVASCTAADADGDGRGACDCDDDNASVWQRPGEVAGLVLSRDAGETRLDWEDSGADASFDVLRSGDAVNFLTATTCLDDSTGDDTTALDSDLPPAGAVFYYAVRATNDCPDGVGSIGRRSNGVPRPARDCP